MNATSNAQLPLETVKYLIHHIFLPPKLPTKDDFKLEHETALLRVITDALSKFKNAAACNVYNQEAIVDQVIAMVGNLRDVRNSSDAFGAVNEKKLGEALLRLSSEGGTIPLHIRAQNAGVIISKVEDSIHVQAFELSPLNEEVIATKGRLRRAFPGPVISLDFKVFDQSSCQATMAHTLAKMSYQSATDTQPRVMKSGRMHDEDRDTTHPKLTTELFYGWLRAQGKPVDGNRMWKNTREDVMWLDSRFPWRRSPMWLLARVSMQLIFSRFTVGSKFPGDLYKSFMLFLISHVLDLSLKHSVACDLTYAMYKKLDRRLGKLDLSVDAPGLDYVKKTSQKALDILATRWSGVREQSAVRYDFSPLANLDFGADTFQALQPLDDYIKLISKRMSGNTTTSFRPSRTCIKTQAGELPTGLRSSTSESMVYDLKAFEAWIASDLKCWLESHKEDPATCGKLGDLIQTYHGAAFPHYLGNAEALSTMVLTILDLWIACDESATSICELLLDYDPEVPRELFQSLALPFKSQMERLLRAEEYLIRRRQGVKPTAPSVFKAFGAKDCFSVRYFDQSLEHQALQTKIESGATQLKQQKISQLRELKEQYESLMKSHDGTECDYHEVVIDAFNDFREQRHSPSCKKCGYKTQAAALSIQVYEWPLPSDALEARSTVFELQVPLSFSSWRDTTIFVILDVLKASYMSTEMPRAKYLMEEYKGLRDFFTPFSVTQRVRLLSENKPHEVTHRRDKSVAISTESDVCLDNGLRYNYHDRITGFFVDKFHITAEISRRYTYVLPEKSSSLQQFLFRPASAPNGPSNNTVIASQSNCPYGMSLEEYKSLATISLGYRLQWQNILLQLWMPSVDFKKMETCLVVLQCINQAGPSESGRLLRDAHEILDDKNFAGRLLDALLAALQRMKENWESSQALSTFISLAARLLSLTSEKPIENRCIAYLASLRATTFKWVNTLRDRAYETANDDERAELRSKAVEVALICADSFNLDKRYLEGILKVPHEASVLIQCSIVIQEGEYTLLKTSDQTVSILHQRWKELSYRAYPILAKEIVEKQNSSLDNAIMKSWSAYQAGHNWGLASEQAENWLVTKQAASSGSNPLLVHFNLLTSELLVNGLPLARLPSRYESHPIYPILFANSTLEVMPTAVPGMQFSGKEEYAGYTLHFGLNSTSVFSRDCDLLVQAVKGNKTYEFVPSRVLRGHFPLSFVDEFVHWYDVLDDSLEFRSVKDPWTPSPRNWRLTRNGSMWRLEKSGTYLIEVKSETAKLLSDILRPLEDPLQMHMSFNSTSSTLEIELPRLHLGFHLKSGSSSIQSRQFRETSIDIDQSIGTIIGLRNKLILKNEKNGNRILVLPEGAVSYKASNDHVSVNVDKGSVTKAHAYLVDEQLGRLVDNGSLRSKLLLCYIHALTSFCLPDPLTKRTGTEQALSILNSAAVRSFDRLEPKHIEILENIARLTPRRVYYPANERVMQRVTWSPSLSFLAQHGWFYKSVKSIFDQANATKMFYPGFYVRSLDLDHVEPDLLERDCIRSSMFQVAGFGAEDHTIDHDKVYCPRDRGQDSPGGVKAFVISSFIYNMRTTLHYDVSASLKSELWTFFSRHNQIYGPDKSLKSSPPPKYDAGLLLDSSKFLSEHWCALHQTLSKTREGSRDDKFSKMIWFSTLAFAKNANMGIIQTLASFLVLPSMAHVHIPSLPSTSPFRLKEGAKPIKSQLLKTVRSSALRPFPQCPDASLAPLSEETPEKFQRRVRRGFESNQSRAVERLAKSLVNQWLECPHFVPSNIEDDIFISNYVDVDKALEAITPKWGTWFDNLLFSQYLDEIVETLATHAGRPIQPPTFTIAVAEWNLTRKQGFISIDNTFDFSTPFSCVYDTSSMGEILSSVTTPNRTTPHLAGLIERLEDQADSKYERDYVKDLRDSLVSLQKWKKEYDLNMPEVDARAIISDHLACCRSHVQKLYEGMVSSIISPTYSKSSTPPQMDFFFAMAAGVKQMPRLSPILFLQQLTRSRWQKITSGWKCCIIQYGLALTELHRAERLAAFSGNRADLIRELQNTGHTNWDLSQYPESLLLEVESGIMIREVQEHIAGQMRDPKCGQNAVMQLNMGEGKSSVIVPIVAAALADGSRLARVIVAKPQAKQMFQMLVSKLGGLLNRRVYHMPFSRSLKLGQAEADAIGAMYRECMEKGGILLVHPEHILSFKLMGLECTLGNEAVGSSLLDMQSFFDSSSRDIVDESDENFSVKFELIYTMGLQRSIELSPERWTCIQQVLELVRRFAPGVKNELPLSLDLNERWPGGFPRTRILRPDAGQRLFRRVAEHICEVGIDGFPIARQPESVRRAVLRYITEPDLEKDEAADVESQGKEGFWGEAMGTTLLLRGLIAGGVLSFAFGQKRWSVNYGLDARRRPETKLAVPYRAKDSPTLRSEFSHPEVVIVLTSLSYYYGGMTNDDLFVAFNHLLKSDQADIEYQAWVKDAPGLPNTFHHLVGINLKDRLQCIHHVFPRIRYAKAVVDYFLTHVIFPKEMKEFPDKFSASGWDIGQVKGHPTTGFSGTNDSRKVLPLSVENLDLPEQEHTNALVLEYLLQPENSVALIPPRKDASRSDAELFLTMVTGMEPTVRVVLDVGAQVLELSNLEVARMWLGMMLDHDRTQAVVYFNDTDDLSVLDRKGNVEALQTSSFEKQLDVCIIFLDEAHTRGTDLRLPPHYRAAVTLGPNLTKDRLVQACMRMRDLGKGQSVVFCIPEEIKVQIFERTRKSDNTSIEVSDVLIWAISETYLEIRRSMALWRAQGLRFERQQEIWSGTHGNGGIPITPLKAAQYLEKEAQSLEDRYGTRCRRRAGSSTRTSATKNVRLIEERCCEFKDLDLDSSTLQEEQERELSPEIEKERQVQRPAAGTPAQHAMHPDLIQFVIEGIPIIDSEAFIPAFETLRGTSAAIHLDVAQFPRDLLVTADFARTVKTSFISDAYQRPVQWIITSAGGDEFDNETVRHMVIISPYEAQELMPKIKISKFATLHIYAPRQNQAFPALDTLDLYSVSARPEPPILPRHLIVQLNLFAGQLYLGSFEEYIELCDLLGLAWDKTQEGVAADGFILKGGSDGGKSRCTFTHSPVKFLKVLMTKIRRNCEGVDKTDMGKILDGRLLLRSDFEELDDEAE